MSRRTTNILKAVLSAMHYSGADSMIAPLTRGIGAIFMLHHTSPAKPGKFEPNRILRISPQFLELVIRQVRASGFEIVSLDEAHFRLVEGDYGKPFVCFTFDDGYRDNLEYAYPIFKRHHLPFAIYVPTDYADGRGDLWWLTLEKVIVQVDALTLKMDGSLRRLRCGTPSEKDATFHTVYWWLRSIDEVDARGIVRELCNGIDFDADGMCRDLMMNWSEIAHLAADPLVTIGGHTRRHYALAKLTQAEAYAEIDTSVRRIEQETGKPCRHFSYPYGDESSAGPREFEIVKELGLKTGVTTRKGLIHPRHAQELTALPRVSLNGDYQKQRYVKVLLSGAPFALLNMVQRGSAGASPVGCGAPRRAQLCHRLDFAGRLRAAALASRHRLQRAQRDQFLSRRR
jgi:peptidoglycan/xylan/chitin deacetylase (PgdA/CDA1 family)